MRVLKFGGSSVATPERIRAVAELVRGAREHGEVAVVVSALGGVTDALLTAAKQAERADPAYRQGLEALAARHRSAVAELAPAAEAEALEERLGRAFAELESLLQGVCLLREASPRTLDRVLSSGERLCSAIVAAAFRAAGLDAEDSDARELIVTDASFGNAQVDFEATNACIRERFSEPGLPLQVVTGFLGATPGGETTTLGRGGSDFTAAILGAALDAEAVELWTDVDGVMSADPRLVPAARPLPELRYEELMELSHFGAKVVYPPSVHPTRSKKIPLWIKNTLNPAAPGTRVVSAGMQSETPSPAEPPIRGIASIGRVALLRLEGDGMVGVPGFAMRLFGALARHGVSVILISQASSEHSICCAVAPGDVEAAREAVGAEFALECRAGLLEELVVEEDLSIVAAVGSAMRERPGIAGRIFRVLGEQGINVRAIAQGSSELNISLVVAARDETAAVRAIHDAFFAPRRTAEIYLAGVGRVGAAFLGQLGAQAPRLAEQNGPRLRLVAAARGQGILCDPKGLEPREVIEHLCNAFPDEGRKLAPPAEGTPLDRLVEAARSRRAPCRLFVDCTASPAVAARYEELLESGCSVVTANKLRPAGPLAEYRRLVAAGPGRLYFETTVGAGLPVLRTLTDQLATGDRLVCIEGLLSGTLSYLTGQLAAGASFSAAVKDAHARGFTEPDPREDLSGRDVARKLLILARIAGREMEPEDIEVKPLLPAGIEGEPDWSALSLEGLWEQLPLVDEHFAALQTQAAKSGGHLAYLALLDERGAQVALEAVSADHPAATVRGTDNLVAFTTERYAETPLVVRGPGAGPEVTAAGVFADVLRAVAEATGD